MERARKRTASTPRMASEKRRCRLPRFNVAPNPNIESRITASVTNVHRAHPRREGRRDHQQGPLVVALDQDRWYHPRYRCRRRRRLERALRELSTRLGCGRVRVRPMSPCFAIRPRTRIPLSFSVRTNNSRSPTRRLSLPSPSSSSLAPSPRTLVPPTRRGPTATLTASARSSTAPASSTPRP